MTNANVKDHVAMSLHHHHEQRNVAKVHNTYTPRRWVDLSPLFKDEYYTRAGDVMSAITRGHNMGEAASHLVNIWWPECDPNNYHGHGTVAGGYLQGTPQDVTPQMIEYATARITESMHDVVALQFKAATRVE